MLDLDQFCYVIQHTWQGDVPATNTAEILFQEKGQSSIVSTINWLSKPPIAKEGAFKLGILPLIEMGLF